MEGVTSAAASRNWSTNWGTDWVQYPLTENFMLHESQEIAGNYAFNHST